MHNKLMKFIKSHPTTRECDIFSWYSKLVPDLSAFTPIDLGQFLSDWLKVANVKFDEVEYVSLFNSLTQTPCPYGVHELIFYSCKGNSEGHFACVDVLTRVGDLYHRTSVISIKTFGGLAHARLLVDAMQWTVEA